jgi:predicted lipid-binding transport protein (Tim44 family)
MIRLRSLIGFMAVLFALTLTIADVQARVGGARSGGSRGVRTFSAPPPTRTAPRVAPIERSITQPTRPSSASQVAGSGSTPRPGLFGGGLMGGLAAGFIGAGLFGLLSGHGLFGGMTGFASLIGFALQLALLVVVVRLVLTWWQRRSAPAFAGPSGAARQNFEQSEGTGSRGSGPDSPDGASAIGKSDYDAFERLLGDIQTAYSNEDLTALRLCVTPEMLSYFSNDLAANANRGVVNRVSDVKLLQGDLAEVWTEGATQYATVAMRFSLIDRMVDRASDRPVEGDDAPQEVTEAWTFMRARGGEWILSAIQQI